MKNNIILVFIEINNFQNVIFFNIYPNYKCIFFCVPIKYSLGCILIINIIHKSKFLFN